MWSPNIIAPGKPGGDALALLTFGTTRAALRSAVAAGGRRAENRHNTRHSIKFNFGLNGQDTGVDRHKFELENQ
jgi:hypothetical protein